MEKINFCKLCKHEGNINECYNCVGDCSSFFPTNRLISKLSNAGLFMIKKKKPLLILGFPGIGKSYTTSVLRNKGYIVTDSDSSLFTKDNFPNNYINHIKECIASNYDIIFVSSHEEVRRRIAIDDAILNESKVYIVYPSKEIKTFWINNLKSRGSSEEFCTNIAKNYDKWIDDIEKENYFDNIKIEYETSPYLLDNLYKLNK